MTGPSEARAPTSEDIGRIGEAVLEALPEPFRSHVGGVPVRVEDFPDDETVADMELESPFDILGLYRGVPIGHDAELGPPRSSVDMIFLYRRPILDRWCEGDETLEEIVRDTLLHEIGHHLGMDEDDLARIGLA